MEEYISKEKAIALLEARAEMALGTPRQVFFAAAKMLEKIPAADVVEVVHGKWEECDWVEYDHHNECIHYPRKGCVCTNCRNAFKKEFVLNPRVEFCPNCGAMMERD